MRDVRTPSASVNHPAQCQRSGEWGRETFRASPREVRTEGQPSGGSGVAADLGAGVRACAGEGASPRAWAVAAGGNGSPAGEGTKVGPVEDNGDPGLPSERGVRTADTREGERTRCRSPRVDRGVPTCQCVPACTRTEPRSENASVQ